MRLRGRFSVNPQVKGVEMEQLKNHADQRYSGQCIYCRAISKTKEHVPPKIFLDRPYPKNLSVVEACAQCNSAFSLDEEYMASCLDCIISGTVDPELVQREKIKRILKKKPELALRLTPAIQTSNNGIFFRIESERFENIVKKIAIGHVRFELSLLLFSDEIPIVSFYFFEGLPEPEIYDFEDIDFIPQGKAPEIGSRAMQRIKITSNGEAFGPGWIEVQPGRYRYAVIQSDRIEVRMVFSEYLACKVIWEDAI